MQIAIVGKGGSGKTTIAGTASRILARRGRSVRAIDADSNPNLAVALGVRPETAFNVRGLPAGLLRVEMDDEGNRRTVLTRSVWDLFEEYGIEAPDNVRLLVGSRIDHAGTG